MEIIQAENLSELTRKISRLNITPETYIRVNVEQIRKNDAETVPAVKKSSAYLFLNDYVWDGEDTPADLAENHDEYLYGDE